jgi:flagellar FliJ protein
MKKFKFRFEKIQGVRRHQEREKQRALAEAHNLEQRQRDAIDRILADRATSQATESAHLTGRVDPARLSGYSRYYVRLRQREVQGRELLRQILMEVERRRVELIAAARQRKMYDKLEEKHRTRHLQAYNQQMQKETDDIGQKVFLRSR